MRTQTKCTITLCSLFIVEIFPLPFTALFGIYIIRKRPPWFPKIVDNLYADKPGRVGAPSARPSAVQNPTEIKTRRRCMMTMVTLTILDLAVPVTIPVGLYVVRKRPDWFEETVFNLYYESAQAEEQSLQKSQAAPATAAQSKEHARKIQEIERQNLDYARAFAERNLVK